MAEEPLDADEKTYLAEIEEYEKKYESKLPKWFRAWIVANAGMKIEQRPPEFL